MTQTAVLESNTRSNRKRGGIRGSGVLLFALAWLSVWWLIIGMLVAPVLPGGGFTVAGVAVLSALPILVLVHGFMGRAYPSAAIRLYVLRPFWYVQLALPLSALAGLSGAIAGAPFGAAGVTGRWVLLAAVSVMTVLAVVGYVGSRALRVAHVDATFDDLPAGLEGMRIVQISDLHVGPHTSHRHLARVVAAIEAAKPDIIAITGDQVDDYAGDVAHFARAFRNLHAPHGVYAVAGNHDVYAGWTSVRRGLESIGITVLVNDAIELTRDGARFWLGGTGDPAGTAWSRGGGRDAMPDVARTVSRIPDQAFTIVLAHNPVLWPALADHGVHLTLSGHTHHGQVSIPRLGWSVATPFLEHAMGTHRRDGAVLYINPGTNYWGLPLRIGALPEVTVVELHGANH